MDHGSWGSYSSEDTLADFVSVDDIGGIGVFPEVFD